MSGIRWLDDDEQRAWRAYLRMQRRLAVAMHRQLQADSGLSLADYAVLVQLTDVPEARLRPYELQCRLDWEQSRLSHQLSRMQRRGLIERQECAQDRRGAFVALTPAGRAAIDAAAPGHVQAVRDLFFDALSPEQVRSLRQVADQVLARIDAAGPAMNGHARPADGTGESA